MGCPVPKVTKTGGGASMMTELPKTQELIRAMVDAVDVPITAKMRLGWDDQNLTAPDLARALEDAGVAAVFVHGRTRAQGFDGSVNLDGIRKVVEAVKNIPVIGNGDVTTPEAAAHMIEKTGCDGISAGRGAFYNPWIFLHTQQFLESGELPPEPSFDERMKVLRRHYDLMVEVFGEEQWFHAIPQSSPLVFKSALDLSNLSTWPWSESAPGSILRKAVADYLEWRKPFLDDQGELLARYQLPPMVATFMQEEDEHQQNSEKRSPSPRDQWKSGNLITPGSRAFGQ